jgi:hypothetical protein
MQTRAQLEPTKSIIIMKDLPFANDNVWEQDPSYSIGLRSPSSSIGGSFSFNSRDDCYGMNQQHRSDRSCIGFLVYVSVLLSWAAAWYLSRQTQQIVVGLESSRDAYQVQYSAQLELFRETQAELKKITVSIRDLEHTERAMNHELQIAHKLGSDFESLPDTNTAPGSQKDIVQRWLEQRLRQLKERASYMQQYLRDYSRVVTLEDFGHGPHRVQFTILLGRAYRTFTVELMSSMPHASLLFLESVRHKEWDNTVFLHHEEVDHVIAAVPVDYTTQQTKQLDHDHGETWTALAYPEYSSDCQHAKYTLGFAGVGPTWYMNTMDNQLSHGPGGQKLALLPGDADPCFARVIQGRETVDDLIQYGLLQDHAAEFKQGNLWTEEKYSWTHIVKAEIL